MTPPEAGPDRDPSNGWEAIAQPFIQSRSQYIGVPELNRWCSRLPQGARVLELACGFGEPVTRSLLDHGYQVWAIEAAPTLAAELHRRFPQVRLQCGTVQESDWFNRKFDAVIAIGLLFLLPADVQNRILKNAGSVLVPGGHLLFTCPWQTCEWQDIVTGRMSYSLGKDRYVQIMSEAGLIPDDEFSDAGENHYFSAHKAVTGEHGPVAT